MAQIFDPLPSSSTNPILCCYVNATSRIQVARITNVSNWYFERVVFPGQRLVFEALPEAQLEIHCGMMASAILSDTIPCDRLCIQEELSAPFDLTEATERSNEGTDSDSGRTTAPATAAP
ncbi:DUF1830 domain-containing protein [Stenomitos frigidus]|uniref:DUF1830 domain-containing protein n=1 Tax=Stenomitos frigidus ULC18 TaxID=2107698 RepID=A0A2T1E369_9CYAN|nr:DUF1830 domain-containing protein [Stenomitos frigidus]PSB27203.1 hypothetical protein C7B82_17170 [Stenomitos frigidus ULC18]